MDNEDIRKSIDGPLFFRYMVKSKIELSKIPIKSDSIEIEFYQTDEFKPYPHYKSISKLIDLKVKK